MTETSRCFAPVSAPDARVLVLGSLPGTRSLERGQYYAQPRNAFWKIMGELFGAVPELPYAQRLQCLIDARVALWDVIAAAVRPGSLDSRIRHDTVEVNDFETFLRAHRSIEQICCNGTKAAQLFARRVAPSLSVLPPPLIVLPSTSPAHAAMSYDDKLRYWRAGLSGRLPAGSDQSATASAADLGKANRRISSAAAADNTEPATTPIRLPLK